MGKETRQKAGGSESDRIVCATRCRGLGVPCKQAEGQNGGTPCIAKSWVWQELYIFLGLLHKVSNNMLLIISKSRRWIPS